MALKMILHPSADDLSHLIRTCPVIDNHGHNILRPHPLRSGNFLTITTEAGGDALEDTPVSLPHLRAARQLRKLYSLQPDADWAAILGRRIELLERDPDGFMKRCFEGTQTILIDDGLDSGASIHPYDWHDQFTRSPCKRIVRIEAVAASILSDLHQQGKLPVGVAIADEEACSLAWVNFIASFEEAIVSSLSDPEVVGFKSVICYRTGLDVTTGRDIEVSEGGLRSFRRHFLPECVGKGFRVEAKGMNDALVISVCKLIAAHDTQMGVAKPLQFHTGLGDNDISLLDSNPACLQRLMKQFPTVPMVLLHSSYPYTREAGYFATVYKNVYLDIGEVFPMVSRNGQENILRQALELTPTSKILWSTDGHHYPETYWLANKQGRDTLEKVMLEYVEHQDLTVSQAMLAAKQILFENSNQLYNLGLKLPDTTEASYESGTVADNNKKNIQMNTTSNIDSAGFRPNFESPSLVNMKLLREFQSKNKVQFIIVQWLDYLGTIRSRCLPIKSFLDLIMDNSHISISMGNLGTLQNDHMSPVCDPVGQILVKPDLHSLRPLEITVPNTLSPTGAQTSTVMAQFLNNAGDPLLLCPRGELQRVTDLFAKNYMTKILVGFEIEITFCKRVQPENRTDKEYSFAPMDNQHSWGSFTDQQALQSFPLIAGIVASLENIGIEVSQFHSEAGPGQYEFVLPPSSPVQAVDTLIQARQSIQLIAASHGFRATCYPTPFPGVGTAAHAHISFNTPPEMLISGREKPDMSIIAAILEHLPSLCAFTMPQAVSYGRVVDDGWTGGTWVAWGSQNREVPIRLVSGEGTTASRWEVRCLDGMANMYLALAAILGAGLIGRKNGTQMTIKNCLNNPTKLSVEQKRALGITKKLPTSLSEALAALEGDQELEKALAPGLVHHYISMKKAEQEMLNSMPVNDRRVFLMERY